LFIVRLSLIHLGKVYQREPRRPSRHQGQHNPRQRVRTSSRPQRHQ
jgi:hypothetical protein